MKRIIVLGCTGSIGRQCLEVCESLPGVRVVGLAAGSRADLLVEQARRLRPDAAAIADAAAAAAVERRLRPLGIQVLAGPDAAEQLAAGVTADLAVAAMVGMAGLRPAMAALRTGKALALANKEVLVAAGGLVTDLARRAGRPIIPIDSEHSAVFQCLQGEPAAAVRRLWLTASGGPFRGLGARELERVTPQQALRHPRWDMGPKVTVDSATLMNKGLEIIEAAWLFDLDPDCVGVLVHPQSIVHSLVEFVDGSVKAQLAPPDMRLPIQYALTWPERAPSPVARLDLLAAGALTFEPPDLESFPCLRLARAAARAGGLAPTALNAANEVAVAAFLAGRLPFPGIARACQVALDRHLAGPADSVERIVAADRQARAIAAAYVEESSP